ncbi:hypothetical protein SEA_BISKIT_65 [Gordonia phage Biskit]|uniref:Uncharacterized protein n=2 Tax=Emalynvirus troje TaxID=2560511 RepID=A0A7G8LQH3_9CAUD|nr:hypothetical protein SEA_SKETCHMEX_63 [Gordonia phage SketchMex]QDM56341.1 hypothetical protein SEA_SWEATNTEARS_65 [Gordonia phage SweatNTears]QNJ59495.1 hypothetical protein SEA_BUTTRMLKDREAMS_65 [Gordonia phage Buttrmlkdreams]UVK62104.1 hypothetical protein SEA_BISKIT_65 [Gordonia phage Biskit]WKW85129.1 hypothetical protein SEA_YUMMY_65 [Gordonia phage Yummy]WKW86940.1 hypothetical protein SEA_HORSERADISH_65 [Gordonia phage Horseradish]
MPEKTKPVLNKKQRRRVAALGVARDVLAAKSLVNSTAVDVQPLIDVARYVIEGRDPLEDYRGGDDD